MVQGIFSLQTVGLSDAWSMVWRMFITSISLAASSLCSDAFDDTRRKMRTIPLATHINAFKYDLRSFGKCKHDFRQRISTMLTNYAFTFAPTDHLSGRERINILIVFRLQLLLSLRLLFSFCSWLSDAYKALTSFMSAKYHVKVKNGKALFLLKMQCVAFVKLKQPYTAMVPPRPSPRLTTYGTSERISRCLRYTWVKLKS